MADGSIQQIIDAAPAATTATVPPGTYLLTQPVTMRSGIPVDLTGSTVRIAAGITARGFVGVDGDFEIIGGTIDLNKANVTDSGSLSAQQGVYVTATNGNASLTMTDTRVINGPEHGIEARAATGRTLTVSLTDIEADDCNRGVFLVNATTADLTRPIATGNTMEGIYCIDGTGYTITDATATDNGGHGIVVSRATDIVITNPTANDNGEYGVVISENCKRFAITGGEARRNGESGFGADVRREPPNGDEVVDTDGSTITGVTSTDNATHGLWVNFASDLTVSGGEFSRNTNSGIYALARSSTFTSNAGTGNGNFGLAFDEGDSPEPIMGGNTATGNTVTGTNGAVFDETTTPNTIT